MWKLLVVGDSPFWRGHLRLFGQKSLSERERGEPWAIEIKVNTPGKIVPYKVLPSYCSVNTNVKKDFDTDILFNQHCHTFSGTFYKVYLIMTKCKQTWYFIDTALLGKVGGVHVTYMVDVDKGQWHFVTLGCSFKLHFFYTLLCFFITLTSLLSSSCTQSIQPTARDWGLTFEACLSLTAGTVEAVWEVHTV